METRRKGCAAFFSPGSSTAGVPRGTLSALGAFAVIGALRAGAGLCGMIVSEQYRRFAEECVQIANGAKDPQSRAILLQMAQVWFRLAQERADAAAEKLES